MGSPGCIQPLCLEAACLVGVDRTGGRRTPSVWLFVMGHGTEQLDGPLGPGCLCSPSPQSKRVEGLTAALLKGVLGGVAQSCSPV